MQNTDSPPRSVEELYKTYLAYRHMKENNDTVPSIERRKDGEVIPITRDNRDKRDNGCGVHVKRAAIPRKKS